MEFLKYIFLIIFSLNVKASNIEGLNYFKTNKECSYKSSFLFLKKDQVPKITPRIIPRYMISCNDKKLRGFILGDKIRTHYQKVFFVINNTKIKHLEIIKFDEPEKYLPPRKWVDYALINKELPLKKIDGISGATLTTSSLKRMIQTINNIKEL